MNCPKCKKEMDTGKVSFMGVQGFSQIMCDFVSDSEKDKGIFKQKNQTKIILPGNETDAYYCAECDLTIPLIK